jgi:hypothetical protein
MADPGLGVWSSSLGLARPQLFGSSLVDISWATWSAN